MDEDLIETLRERLAMSQAPRGFTPSEVGIEADDLDSVLDAYCSEDPVRTSIAAFRLSSFLGEKKETPVKPEVAHKIALALLVRLRDQSAHLGGSDLEMGVLLWRQGVVGRSDIEILVERMKGRHDMLVAGLASHLIPIIGTGFLSDYLNSSELFETGGMGGPERPMLREMARDALAAFNRN